MAENTKIAELANTYNGTYEELRSEENIQKHECMLGEVLFQNLPAGRRVAGGAVKCS